MSFLGRKWSEWEDVVASNPNTLTQKRSVANVDHTLRLAVSPAAQKMLCNIVVSRVPELIKDTLGCSILTSLIKYGTKATVALIAPLAVTNVVSKSLTINQGALLCAILRRPMCNEDVEKAINAMLPNLLDVMTEVAASRHLTASILGFSPKLLIQHKKKIIEFFNNGQAASVAGFVDHMLTDAAVSDNTATVIDFVWSVKSVHKNVGVVLAISKYCDVKMADNISEYVQLRVERMLTIVPYVIKKASELAAQKLAAAVVKNVNNISKLTEGQEALAAVFLRFPEYNENTSVTGAAIKWSRSNVDGPNRTRQMIKTQIFASKRPRENDDF